MLLLWESSKIIFHQFLFDKKTIKPVNASNAQRKANEQNDKNVKRVSVNANMVSPPCGKASNDYARPAKEGCDESVDECPDVFKYVFHVYMFVLKFFASSWIEKSMRLLA